MNARVHTPAGTKVRVKLTKDLLFEVTDDGPGWPETVLAAAEIGETKRFARGRNRAASGGSGLGPAIVAGIVAAHNGELTLSDNHPGAIVRVKFDPADVQS